MFWFPKECGGFVFLLENGFTLDVEFSDSIHKNKELVTMIKKLLLLAAMTLALATAIAGDVPIPPCIPTCLVTTSSTR